MAWGPDEKVETLNERTLGSTSLTDTMVVRYYKPKNSAQAPDKEK
jgi:hypothetical protein